ncbi:hypothetical protein RK09_04260 [Kocuria rhizophila]|nr:hypothetical protein RK09_04260 [Kocuria rhizophila]
MTRVRVATVRWTTVCVVGPCPHDGRKHAEPVCTPVRNHASLVLTPAGVVRGRGAGGVVVRALDADAVETGGRLLAGVKSCREFGAVLCQPRWSGTQ